MFGKNNSLSMWRYFCIICLTNLKILAMQSIGMMIYIWIFCIFINVIGYCPKNIQNDVTGYVLKSNCNCMRTMEMQCGITEQYM